MKEYILVTGSNGYLGKYVCRELIEKGYHVIGMTFPHFASTRYLHPRIEYIECDISQSILSQDEVVSFLNDRKLKAIVNLAALLGSSDYDKNYAVNALGVKHLIEYARNRNVKRFIQISSVVVLKKIKGPYGITKQIGQEFLENSDLDYTVFIPAMILGPEGLGINRILKNVNRFPFVVPLVGYGKHTQHPIFVKDFAEVIVSSISNQISLKKTYEIGGNEIISFKDLIRMILKINKSRKILVPVPVYLVRQLGKFFQLTQRVPLFTAEHVKGVLQDSLLNTSKYKADFNFKPTELSSALEYSMRKINNNTEFYLNPREEEIIDLQDVV